jgi:hypothetical protein
MLCYVNNDPITGDEHHSLAMTASNDSKRAPLVGGLHQPMSVATFNVEQNLSTKMRAVLAWCESNEFDFVALQEVGRCNTN